MNSAAKSPTPKKVKNKGPIRFEAIVPICIILILIGTYFKYFFDSHLKKAIEFGATYAHGAEVNVGELRTLFLEPSLCIRNIEVTDKSEPQLNIIQIGEIKLELMWDALLRGKFVIPEASILGIQAKSPRKRPGKVRPPKESKGKSAVTLAAEETLNELQQKNESNVLGNVFALAGGSNYQDQLKTLEGEVRSQAKIKALNDELKLKEQEWKKRIDDLPDESEIKQLGKKIEGLKIDTSSPQAIQASIKEVDQVFKEARVKYKDLESTKKLLDQDLKNYRNEYKGLEALIKQDIEGLANKLNIPSLDPNEINKMLLGSLVANQLGGLLKYQDMAREFMPSKYGSPKSERKELTPRERAQGVNYTFTKAKSYPRFWLKKAKISSISGQGEAGDMEGQLLNVTNNPRHLGLPATFDFKGGFPKPQILDVQGNITIDHTTNEPTEHGFVSVGSFPVKKNTLTQSKDVSLGYNSAKGSSRIDFNMKDRQIEINSRSVFTELDYFVTATDKNVERLLTNVTKDLDNLDLNIKAQGAWNKLRLNINSNLGDRLVRAIKGQIEAEIKKARQQVEQHVQGLIAGERAKLDKELGQLEQKLGVSLKSREDAVKSVEQTADNKKKEVKKEQQQKIDKAKDEVKDKAKKLLKGVKF
jgi:uncharacterized protein (TIGR03545 family)